MSSWKYTPVVNVCLQILLTVGLGAVLGRCKVVTMDHVPILTTFVFRVALPCLVVKGVGVGVDFYSDAFIWEYIGAFLLLRAVSLIVAVSLVAAQRSGVHGFGAAARADATRSTVGDVAVVWLNFTWISTVILGIPILTAVFGSPRVGQFYGLLAGLSSFIFQLPFMLGLFECHSLAMELKEASGLVDDDSIVVTPEKPDATAAPPESSSASGTVASSWRLILRRDVWGRALNRVARNPVIWGIAGGLLISLSTLGERYLRPSSYEYVSELGFFVDTLGWFGDTVSPVSLFAMGIWMQHQGRNLFAVGAVEISLYMLAKLFLTPLLMIGLAKMLDLDDRSGRAAVLIATLPVSLASFTLGDQYGTGQASLAANVAVGTMLMLPTVVAWAAAMDDANLYPV